MDDNAKVEFQQVIWCKCGNGSPLWCVREDCMSEWLPVIYVDPEWPNETESNPEADNAS